MRILHSLFFVVAALAMLNFTAMPADASKTDSRIEATARQTYVFKTYLQADDIKVQSKDGAVTLTGVVADESHKSLAQDTVASLPGVKSVDNRLEIKGAPPSANSDAWLRDKVKITLLFHSSVSASKTEVDVKDGIVTLRGDTSSFAQKQLATEYAMDINGVKEVKNEMTVTTTPPKKRTVGEKIDDASITAQVKMTLLYHRSTSAVKTSVTTKHGMVSLSGKASNADEIKLATKLASDVIGVKSVKNLMTIE
ncbi:Osmotically-inducible protein OsmY, contains BON domain [Trichlorobacter thiogenes]|uniref:Osmotically-inducible protein OsmY, contains BON domain n=1 Tax=Trichlorobacter thiogenes TaxID=115783 RepID=A0A1T4QXI8_9BACT|nr:BON domain-containing protein [Trichlorobacter thiogenes]SKA08463.1 Osmotically-inducible protein OsmY, contains BON domain [Trichlorobacter thiogenes]